MKSLTPAQLSAQWQAVSQGAGEAIDWIDSTRKNAPRLNTEADNLIVKLRRSRNKARSLSQAALKPMTVGFFGLSQAGKSYLISALAAGENGKLETSLGGQQLDFLTHINPPGGGKEATGLVTRFSRQAAAGSDTYPVELLLFSEVEIGKILANAFLHDFNPEKFAYELDEKRIAEHLKMLSARRQPAPVAGLSSDDVVALWDYLTRHAENSQKRLVPHFWPAAIELAPYLSIDDRASLFSVLWGEIGELTDAYRRFGHSLQRLSGANKVLAPLSALVKQQDGILVQADSIMNVDMLERLNKPSDQRIQVCPVVDNQIGAPVELSLAELTALTVELVIPLLTSTREALFEQVDLLDFPGYRGRLGVESMDDVRRAVNSDDANPLAQLILRGKVAYLFERYTDQQEMNVLVVCTASSKQSDVKEVGGVLDEWIKHTQGENAQIRGRRKPGLIWALTMFDQRITNSLSHDEALLRQSWGKGGMIKMAMLERFGQYEWLQEWQPGQPFNNTFLVRKPRFPVSFIRMQNQCEVALQDDSVEQLQLMRRTFIEDASVQSHVANPGEAWDAMLQLDNGGMARMAEYLSTVALPLVKLERIAEQLHEVQRELVDNRLGAWYQQGGSEEFVKKQRIAEEILKALQTRTGVHGELLDRLLPTRDELRSLYLQEHDEPSKSVSQEEESHSEPAASNAFGIGSDFDLFSDTPAPSLITDEPRNTSAAVSQGYETEYARNVLHYWINHLRNMPENDLLVAMIGISKPIFEALADELITACQRLGVEQELLNTLAGTEQVIARRDEMVERQVSRVLTVLSDFVSWFGFLKLPESQRPESRINRGSKIFALPNAQAVQWDEPYRLQKLTPQPINYTAFYIYDWLIGLQDVIKDNAGHSAGREISAEQNDRLGVILKLIKPSQSE